MNHKSNDKIVKTLGPIDTHYLKIYFFLKLIFNHMFSQ